MPSKEKARGSVPSLMTHTATSKPKPAGWDYEHLPKFVGSEKADSRMGMHSVKSSSKPKFRKSSLNERELIPKKIKESVGRQRSDVKATKTKQIQRFAQHSKSKAGTFDQGPATTTPPSKFVKIQPDKMKRTVEPKREKTLPKEEPLPKEEDSSGISNFDLASMDSARKKTEDGEKNSRIPLFADEEESKPQEKEGSKTAIDPSYTMTPQKTVSNV
mmetsp:Transcript_39576/g.60500  ORF Transcript_39576/g.60500 Transcript_39576/m.60500 type:complete len:216 (+) Transcript_39576:4810-5457(+)